jgi:hypothetical protein
VPENSPRKYFERIENTLNFTIETGDFYITDVFKATQSGAQVPLYFRHDLSFAGLIQDVELLDGNLNKVNQELYSFYDESALQGSPAQYIYTNIENSYDSGANEYSIYYYRYKEVSTGRVKIGLLDTKPFYRVVSFEAPRNQRSYRVETRLTHSYIQIWFNSRQYSPTANPSLQQFAIKAAGADRVALLPPLDLAPNQRWYPRITVSEFYRDTGVTGDRLFYYVPEYYSQFFSPVPPFKSMVEKEIKILDPKLLYVSPSPIANLGVGGFYLYIILKDSMGRAVQAITNDPAASVYITKDKVITDIYYERDLIQSVDSAHGFIKLNRDIKTDLKAFITCRYEEQNLTYRDINVNSTINPSVLNTSLLFYIIPESTTPSSRSVFHLQIDEEGNILGAPQDSSFITHKGMNEEESTIEIKDSTLGLIDVYTNFELEIVSGKNSGRRVKVTSYNPLTKTLTLATPALYTIEKKTEYRINKKLKNYVYPDSVSSTVFSYQGWENKYLATPYYYVLLGNMYAVQTLAPRNISISDIRIKGGGIRPNRIKEALNLQDEIQWFWDEGYWDGQSYPGMGAVIVEVPRSLLEEVGGSFTRQQIQDAVEKHMAAGSHPIIRYYDQSTLINRLEPGDRKVFVDWQDSDAASYNIYYGTTPGSLTLYRNVAGVITSLMVEGLNNGTTYYFKVESVVRGVAQLSSKTMLAIPYNASTVKSPSYYGNTLYLDGAYRS